LGAAFAILPGTARRRFVIVTTSREGQE
jgi:hypothetical protein